MQQMNIKENIVVYSAEAANRSITGILYAIVKDFPRSHELGLRLFKRNLKALYRQSLFGFGWALLPPLATAALWIFLRGSNVVNMGETSVPYPVFVLTGTTLWQIFTEAILTPLQQVMENRTMLAKINIPREGLLLAGLYQLLFNTGLKLLLLTIVYLFFRQTVSITSLACAPLGIFSLGLAGFSIGLALAPLGMLYQDISRGLGVFLPFFMYLTPVVYPPPQEGGIGLLMKLNPIATLLTQTRNWLTAQPAYGLSAFWVYSLFFAILLILSLVVYRLAMPMIIERMGA